jgi:streptogramin lyase
MTDRRRHRWFPLAAALGCVLCAAADEPADWPALPPNGLAFRGVEHAGRAVEENPGWPIDLLTLFVTGKDPDRAWHGPQEHVAWAAQPAHSYVADGTGALVVVARPQQRQFEQICRLEGLTGVEVATGGNAASGEPLWDQLLTWCVRNRRTPLWGFAGDDTHGAADIDRSWVAVRLNRLTEATAKGALRVGNFYLSNGPVISDIQVRGGTVTVRLARAGDVRWLRAGQYGTGTPQVTSEPGADRCLKLDESVTQSSYTLAAGDGTTNPAAMFIRFIVTEGQGARAAQSQPFVLTGPEAMENPYSPEGTWFKGQTHNHCAAGEGFAWRVAEYHAAYEAKGHAMAFHTAGDCWATPLVKYPPRRTPDIERVEPDRLPVGAGGRLTLFGRGLTEEAIVRMDGNPIEDLQRSGAQTEGAEDRIAFDAPAGLKVGRHEITVRNGDGLQDTAAFIVQTSASANDGWTRFAPGTSRLGSRHATALAADAEGGVWVATSYGLNHFDGRQWTLLRADPQDGAGLLSNTLYDLALDPDGTLWFTCAGGVGRLAPDGKLSRWIGEQVGFPCGQVNQVLRGEGRTYVSTHRRHGLFALEKDTWRQMAVKLDPPRHVECVLGMARDAAGRLWMGTAGSGLLCLDTRDGRETWRQFTKENAGLPDDYVTRVAFDAKGRLWLTTATAAEDPTGGLACLDPDAGTCTVYDPRTSPLPERRCWSLWIDREDNLWVGTGKGAACRRADGQWQVYNVTNSGLSDNLVTDICQDKQGNIWFATANGVSRLAAPQTTPESPP